MHGQLKGDSKGNTSSTDILYISGGTKSGSTWLQQIIHQLHTGGDMDFGKLFDVPIVEFAHDLQQDLEADQKGFPRCFKTHYWYVPPLSKGCQVHLVCA